MTVRLARWCLRHKLVVLLGWLAMFIGLSVLSRLVGADYTSEFRLPNTESTRAASLLEREFPEAAGESDRIVVQVAEGTVRDAPVRTRVTQMLERIAGLPHVTGVTSPFQSVGQISRDGTIAVALVHFNQTGPQLDKNAVRRVIAVAESAEEPGLHIALGGHAIADTERFSTRPSEGIGLAAAAIVLFLAFGSLLAMAVPVGTAVVALGSALALTTLLTRVLSIAEFAPALAALLGLGVGVDYALFIVSRFRQELLAGASTEQAVVTAVDTSGRAVFFAGLTVCVSVLGMFALGISLLHGIAVAAAVAVAVTMAAALTFVPALLGMAGPRVLSRREQRALRLDESDGPLLSRRWMRWAGWIQQHPVAGFAGALAILAALALPALSLRLGVADEGNNPRSSTTRQAYDLISEGFGRGFNGPFEIALDLAGTRSTGLPEALAERLRGVPDVSRVLPPEYGPGRRAAVLVVIPATSPQAEATATLLNRLRDDVIPDVTAGTGARGYVGGTTASFADFSLVIEQKLPQFIGIVVLLAFLILMMLFRSLLVPLKAALLNLTSILAAFGVVVAVFQWGWGASIIGVGRSGPIESFLPVMLFAILFGLSMDYEVFLVSRMHEDWIRTGDNAGAVSRGLAATGRVITAAAAVMVLVFAAFVFGGERVIKLFGVGFGVAVLVDAIVIRALLVPAVMQLMGRANWWLPRWLDRRLPRLHLESDTAELDLTKTGGSAGVRDHRQ